MRTRHKGRCALACALAVGLTAAVHGAGTGHARQWQLPIVQWCVVDRVEQDAKNPCLGVDDAMRGEIVPEGAEARRRFGSPEACHAHAWRLAREAARAIRQGRPLLVGAGCEPAPAGEWT